MSRRSSIHRVFRFAMLLLLFGPAAGASPPAAVPLEYRGETIVTFRSWLQGEHLIVEATHKKPWHTYAMDNLERARQRSGKGRPDTELPTRVDVRGALTAAGPWRQTAPLELSQPALRWFTWGFDGISYFAVPVAQTDGGAEGALLINGQACTNEMCAMIDDLEVAVSTEARPSATVNLDELVPLLRE